MNLTAVDLGEIRDIVKSALAKQSEEDIKPIQHELQAIRNDIEEIYNGLTSLENRFSGIERKIMPAKEFEKLSLEQKILKLNSEILIAAKQAGIELPR